MKIKLFVRGIDITDIRNTRDVHETFLKDSVEFYDCTQLSIVKEKYMNPITEKKDSYSYIIGKRNDIIVFDYTLDVINALYIDNEKIDFNELLNDNIYIGDNKWLLNKYYLLLDGFDLSYEGDKEIIEFLLNEDWII